MSTVTTSRPTTPTTRTRMPPGRRPIRTGPVATVLAAVTALAIGTGMVVLDGPGSAPADPTPSAGDAAHDRAADVAGVVEELASLRSVVRASPSVADAFGDRIELLRLVTTGDLPVEAAQSLEPGTDTGRSDGGVRTAAIVDARRELRGMRDVVRTSPSLEPALREEIALLDAVARGFVPVEAVGALG